MIEHDMNVVEGASDRVIAMDHGVKIAEGRTRGGRRTTRRLWRPILASEQQKPTA